MSGRWLSGRARINHPAEVVVGLGELACVVAVSHSNLINSLKVTGTSCNRPFRTLYLGMVVENEETRSVARDHQPILEALPPEL